MYPFASGVVEHSGSIRVRLVLGTDGTDCSVRRQPDEVCACTPPSRATGQSDERKGFAVLGDLAGTAPLHKALLTTNDLLAQVLEELRTTNGRRLETVAAELRTINATLAELERSPAPAG